MSLKSYKFSNTTDLNNFLKGIVIGGKAVFGNQNALVYGLVGLKMKFIEPTAVEYTFVAGASADDGLTFAEIQTQLQGGVTGLVVGQQSRALTLASSTTAGVEFDSEPGSSSAAPFLGFGSGASGKVTPYAAPDGTKPRFLSVCGVGETIVAVVEE